MPNSLYSAVLFTHSYLRWIVILAAAVSITIAVVGMIRHLPLRPWGKLARVLYVSILDVQFLLGAIMLAGGPIIRKAMEDWAIAMKTRELRFFFVEHLLTMLVAVTIAHVGSVRARKAPSEPAQFGRIFRWYTASLVILLSGIPWWRPLFR